MSRRVIVIRTRLGGPGYTFAAERYGVGTDPAGTLTVRDLETRMRVLMLPQWAWSELRWDEVPE